MIAPTGKSSDGERSTGKSRRFLWFVAFYGASLIVFTALVYTLRAVVKG